MPIDQVRQAVIELLFAVDLAEPEIANDLEELLSVRSFYAPAELEASLLSRALTAHVQRVEQTASNDRMFDQRIFPPSKMKKGWRPREHVVLKLQQVFSRARVEVGFLREEFISVRMANEKLIWSRCWDVEFVLFTLKSWWDELLSEISAEASTRDANVVVESAALANAVHELRRQFCDWNNRLPQKWQPSLGTARRLESLGVPREVTYHVAFVSGFINQVNAKKLPFKDFDFNYIKYVIKARESIERIEADLDRKRKIDGSPR